MRRLIVITGLLGAVLAATPAWAQESGGASSARKMRPGQAQPPPPAPVPPTPKLVVDRPTRKTHVREGQSGRFLMGGVWYFRPDDTFVGETQRWYSQRSLQGWTRVDVPHNWNARDYLVNAASVGWYRKEFRLPTLPEAQRQGLTERERRAARKRFSWRIRFLAANHRATVWLNGRKLGSHAGGYVPFELDLSGLKKGRNRLVVRVSTIRSQWDLTHWRLARFNGRLSRGTGGWWNFGGLLREVYVRRIDRIDIPHVTALTHQRCNRCAARVDVRIRLRNYESRKARIVVGLQLGSPGLAGEDSSTADEREIELKPRFLAGGHSREIETSFHVRRPRLWQPGRPYLYPLTVTADAGELGKSRYSLALGIRRITKRADGVALLNGRPLQLRGASIHEDHALAGGAWGPRQRSQAVSRLRQLGATVTRAHYPLHPTTLEALDRSGILYWSDAPVYQVPEWSLAQGGVRAAAVRANRDVVLANANHPSIFAWALANELPEPLGAGQGAFVQEAATAVRELDDTRLVALDRANRLGPSFDTLPLGLVDAFGVNEYFGWYRSSLQGQPASRSEDFGPYLDAMHAAHPSTALFITEFGAESNRAGPVTEKGTYEFQVRWLLDHLAIYAARPYVGGAITWILRDFRVHPTWGGGNPKPNPPWNNKGLIDEWGAPKPAFWELQRSYRATAALR